MQLSEFLSHLTQHPTLELIFEFEHGAIRKDYHLTEVLRLTVDAMDCGGAMDRWSETVLQLVEPGSDIGERFMSADKAAVILGRSHERLGLDSASDVLLEYKPASAHAAQRFHIASIQIAPSQLRVIATGTRTQCKAGGRSRFSPDANTQVSSCCAPGATQGATRPGVEAQSPRACCA